MSKQEPIQEMICISCPLGCRLSLYKDEKEELTVTGNKCKRGVVYAEEEFYSPKRVVTCTCRAESMVLPRLPVRTTTALPKEHIDELLKAAYELTVKPPVSCGQVLIEDFNGTGVNLIASMSLARDRAPAR